MPVCGACVRECLRHKESDGQTDVGTREPFYLQYLEMLQTKHATAAVVYSEYVQCNRTASTDASVALLQASQISKLDLSLPRACTGKVYSGLRITQF